MTSIRLPADPRRKPARPTIDRSHPVNQGCVFRTAPYLMGGTEIHNLITNDRIGFSGTPTWEREKGVPAVDFGGNGSGDYIDTGILLDTGWSFGVWYVQDAITTFDAHGAWSNLAGGGNARAYVGFFDNVGGQEVAGFGDWTSSRNNTLNTNKIYAHIVSSNDATAYWWLDGVLVDSGSYTYENGGARSFYIGGRNSSATSGLDNELDGRVLQVMIWNRFVTPAEARLLTGTSPYLGLVAPRIVPVEVVSEESTTVFVGGGPRFYRSGGIPGMSYNIPRIGRTW